MRPPGNIIGKQISRLRSARGLSQAALAAKCQLMGWDLSREVLARIEGRVRMVTDTELIHLARALAVELTALFPQTVVNQLSRAVRSPDAKKRRLGG